MDAIRNSYLLSGVSDMGLTMIVSLVAVVVLGYVIMLYNNLVQHKNRFKNAFSQIDVQLQRRHELIPNLVEIAKGYLKHETETLTSVTLARNSAADKRQAAASNPEDAALVHSLAQAESSLTGAMGRMNIVMEAYPELKADERMRDLHDQLTTTENRVAFSRQAYSDSVMRYNTYREQFPANLLAGLFNFRAADLFEIRNDEVSQPVKVSFA